MPRGQFEAAKALGIRPYQAWWYVIMPQVARLALPGLTNIWVSVLKDTALVALAGLNEIVMRSRTASGATKEPFIFFVAAALFFIVFSSVTLKLSARLERRLDQARTPDRGGDGRMSFDPALAWQSLPVLLHGLLVTMALAAKRHWCWGW